MSDTASHFKNHVTFRWRSFLVLRFSVANSPWSNGTCERMMRVAVRMLKVMIQEERRSTQNWVELVPVVQWALNTALCEMYCSTPYHVMFGRAPRRVSSTLAPLTGQDWPVDVLDDKALRKKVQSLVQVQIQLHKEVLDKVQAKRGKQRAAASRGHVPNFSFGEYVLVVRVRRSGLTPKYLMT